MIADEIAAALTLVREETDLNSKALLLAGLALVGRVYAAASGSAVTMRMTICVKLMPTVLTRSEVVPCDWQEAYRVAASPKYRCTDEFNAVRAEVEAELANRTNQLILSA